MNEIRKQIQELKEQKRQIDRRIKELEDNTLKVGEYVKFNKIQLEKNVRYEIRVCRIDSFGYYKWYRIYDNTDILKNKAYCIQLIQDLTQLVNILDKENEIDEE